jgi:hypothetical protein
MLLGDWLFLSSLGLKASAGAVFGAYHLDLIQFCFYSV